MPTNERCVACGKLGAKLHYINKLGNVIYNAPLATFDGNDEGVGCAYICKDCESKQPAIDPELLRRRSLT